MTELTVCQAKNDPLKSINTVSSMPALATIRKLTSCQAKNAPKSIKTISFTVAPATIRELASCQAKNAPKSIKTISFTIAPATIRELASCQAKRLSASLQLQPPSENLLSVKPRIPQEHQDCQLHYSSSNHERTYRLSSQQCPKRIKTVSFIPAPATIRELTDCQPNNATRASRLSVSFQL